MSRCSSECTGGRCCEDTAISDVHKNQSYIDSLATILRDVDYEVQGACRKYPAFHSAHEGFAILKEEVDELWEQVRIKQGQRIVDRLRHEAIQVAAMAVRFVLDLGDERGQR